MDQPFLNYDFMFSSAREIIKYLPVTLKITTISMFFALLIGFFTALIRIYKTPVLKQLTGVYISFTRGTPLLVQMYLAYYGLPKFLDYMHIQHGWNINVNHIPAIVFVYIAFSFNVGAYLSENIRASIEAVDKGQMEAALSVGMSTWQGMKNIILPQALTIALPSLGNALISLLKDTSLAFIISVVDMMGQAKIVGARGLNFFEVYIVVALLYWVICILIEKFIGILERKIRKYEGGKTL